MQTAVGKGAEYERAARQSVIEKLRETGDKK